MLKGTVTVAGHEIPSWAKCYCVARHFPTYVHVLPYVMPGDNILYLCPASHHALTTYMKLCDQLEGPPSISRLAGFPLVVQRLGHLLWAVGEGKLTVEQYIRMETYKRLGRQLDHG